MNTSRKQLILNALYPLFSEDDFKKLQQNLQSALLPDYDIFQFEEILFAEIYNLGNSHEWITQNVFPVLLDF